MTTKLLQRKVLALFIVLTGFIFQPAYGGESQVTVTQTYYTDYFTSFAHKMGNNFFREADGTLHLAIVDNYELFYMNSVDDGANWVKEKIPSAHDGDVHLAVLTVDQNGKVHVGFTVNDDYNYGNPTGVGYASEFKFDVYSVTNQSGSWVEETIYKPTRSGFSDNYGGKVTAMVVDGDNNVHLFANRYGWYNYGGEAWEWTRTGSANTWGSQVIVAAFSDTPIDIAISGYYRPVVAQDGTITLVMLRPKGSAGTNDELFYVTGSGGVWSAPVIIDTGFTREYAGSFSFDAAIDSSGVTHLVYQKTGAGGAVEVFYSTDFGAPAVIYTGYIGPDKSEEIWDLKLHSNAAGDLTTLIRHGYRLSDNSTELMNVSLLKRPSGGAWSAPADLPLPVSAPDGDVWNDNVALTDTASGVWGDFQLTYMDLREIAITAGPHGPYEVYHYSEETLPMPDIKANGSDGPVVHVTLGQPLVITASLNPGSHAGEAADWWLVAESPMGRYWYTLPSGWVQSAAPISARSGALVDLAPYTVLEMSTLPVGTYQFLFSVDGNMDGVFDRTYEDTLSVSIQ